MKKKIMIGIISILIICSSLNVTGGSTEEETNAISNNGPNIKLNMRVVPSIFGRTGIFLNFYITNTGNEATTNGNGYTCIEGGINNDIYYYAEQTAPLTVHPGRTYHGGTSIQGFGVVTITDYWTFDNHPSVTQTGRALIIGPIIILLEK